MEGRKKLADHGVHPVIFEAGEHRIDFSDCITFAEMGNLPANILDYVFKTRNGQFVRVTIGSESDKPGDVQTADDRWYTAYMVDEMQAKQWRSSWEILREQPGEPSGPWR